MPARSTGECEHAVFSVSELRHAVVPEAAAVLEARAEYPLEERRRHLVVLRVREIGNECDRTLPARVEEGLLRGARRGGGRRQFAESLHEHPPDPEANERIREQAGFGQPCQSRDGHGSARAGRETAAPGDRDARIRLGAVREADHWNPLECPASVAGDGRLSKRARAATLRAA